MKHLPISHGVKMYKMELGTWQSSSEGAYRATRFSLENNYQHLDTAGNRVEVGRGIKDSGIARDDVLITSKIPAE